MLILSRKSGQRILIGDSIELEVVAVRGKRVQIGFTAPAEVPIRREEVDRRNLRRLRGETARDVDEH